LLHRHEKINACIASSVFEMLIEVEKKGKEGKRREKSGKGKLKTRQMTLKET